jgi:hypothetical protein
MTLILVAAGRCQFCHRTADDVDQMLAGDSSFICNRCVQTCVAALGPRIPATGIEADRADRYVFQRLARHFSPHRPHEMLATSRTFPSRQQADLQLALDDLLGERRVPETFLGLQTQYRHEGLGYSKLLEQSRGAAEIGPAQFEELDIGAGEPVRCLKNGLWLLRDGELPYAVILAQIEDYQGGSRIALEIVTPPGEQGAALSTRVFDAIERRLSTQSCYRGRVLSLEQPYQWSGQARRIQIHQLEPVVRDALILPEATIQSVERNVLRFAEQRPALRALGLSTQKGLLFCGPPGTGKTHCIRYLAGSLKGHTTLLITAEQVGLLSEYMSLARLLQPTLIVIEDADLIARERSQLSSDCDEVLLNKLLNELDGLREKADVFFILTTNRPEMLEPALVSRPGRIDQAIEFPLPTVELRRRLIALYARGLSLPATLVDELAQRTEGASPAFIKELLRRIAQHNLESGGAATVTRGVAEAALHEMLFSGGVLNKRLLGGEAVQ